jgi:hypothetical protein
MFIVTIEYGSAADYDKKDNATYTGGVERMWCVKSFDREEVPNRP